jgi:hypothetical protein
MGKRDDGYKRPDGGKDHKKPDDVKNDSPPKDDGKTDCPTNDGDCCDQQACLISANVQASALGLDVCADVCVGGDLALPLDVADLDLPIGV